IKKLVKFFTKSPKQSKRLDNAQQEYRQHLQTQNYNLAEASSSNDSNSDDLPVNVAEDMPSFRHEESSDDNSDESDFEISKALTNYRQIDSNRVTPTNSSNNLLQNAQVIKTIRSIIYNSLFDYWNEPVMTGLLASLLDPRLETLSSWDEKTQEEAKAELTHQFELLIATNLEQTTASTSETSKNSDIRHGRLYSSIFGTATNNLNS
ncbi:14387_t:CDS:2, partial [Gigaspora rosea]